MLVRRRRPGARQGHALDALRAFFSAVLRAGAGAPGASFDALLAALLAAGMAPAAGRSAQHNIAQCIAVLCGEAGPATLAATVEGLLSQLQVCFTKAADLCRLPCTRRFW